MQIITSTELRTKSKQLIKSLKDGKTIELIHRSKTVALIKPKISEPKPFNPAELAKRVAKLNLPNLTAKQIEARYRAAMIKKNGQDLS